MLRTLEGQNVQCPPVWLEWRCFHSKVDDKPGRGGSRGKRQWAL